MRPLPASLKSLQCLEVLNEHKPITKREFFHAEGIKKKQKIAWRMLSTEYDSDYFVVNAEDTEFDKNSFYIVVGTGIIHHLDLLKSYQEF